MSLVSMIGPRPNLLGRHAGTHKRLEVAQPVLTNADLEKIRSIEELLDGAFRTATIDTTWPASEGAAGLEKALERICAEATDCVLADSNILILSDRAVSAERMPIPALLATAAVHHHLIRQGLRMQTGLVVETGEAREVHHFCVPGRLWRRGDQPLSRLRDAGADPRPERPAAQGLRGAEELHQGGRQGHAEGDVQDGHLDLPVLLRRADLRRRRPVIRASSRSTSPAPPPRSKARAGRRSPRRRCAAIATPTATIRSTAPCSMSAATMPSACAARTMPGRRRACRQAAARGARQLCRTTTRPSRQTINEQSERLLTIRGLMQFKWADKPIPIDEVEPAADIVKRFATGAMSFGSISREAHTTLAIAMNRIGGRSNTGEGGEEAGPLQAACRTAIRCARRSSRSRRAASASRPNTWSMPTTSRSRWRRAPSPARAASCPATRSTRTSPACATRRPASA